MTTIAMLANNWHSQRFVIADSQLYEIKELQEIYDACRYMLVWEGKYARYSPHYIRDYLAGKDLPPDGRAEQCRLQSIRDKANQQLVGYLEFYHGYPSATTLWLGLFSLSPPCQRKGYGQEIIRQFLAEIAQLHFYTSVELRVSLKNWPALRFWTQLGFDRIKRHYGDKIYSADNAAGLVLEYRWEK